MATRRVDEALGAATLANRFALAYIVLALAAVVVSGAAYANRGDSTLVGRLGRVGLALGAVAFLLIFIMA